MKQNNKIIILWLLLMATGLTVLAQGTEHRVNNRADFQDLIDDGIVQAGDVIIWENGTYDDDGRLKFLGVGTAENPITFKAETPGGVQFTGGMTMKIAGEHLVIDGFYWNGGFGANNFIEFRDGTNYANNCTIQNCAIDGVTATEADFNEGLLPELEDDGTRSNPSVEKQRWIVLYGTYNSVLNCSFMNKNTAGAIILAEYAYNAEPPYDEDAGETPENTRCLEVGHTISNNYFYNYEKISEIYAEYEVDGKDLSNAGDSETIRIGTSEYQNVNSNVVVSGNYFVKADGENEIITNKSKGNTYANNTFRSCRGSLVLRHGSDCVVDGNYFLGEDTEGSGGIRIVDSNHTITNNYIQDCVNTESQAQWNNGITFLGGGDSNAVNCSSTSVSNGYQKVENINVSNNTIINTNAPLYYNTSKGSNDPTGDVDNNLIYFVADDANLTPVISGSYADLGTALDYSGNVYTGTTLGATNVGFTEDTGVSVTQSGEIYTFTGASGKGANMAGFEPHTDSMVGDNVGACFLTSDGTFLNKTICTVEGATPIDSINATSVSEFSSAEGAATTTVVSTLSWSAVSNDDWITISPSTGDVGETEVAITVTGNDLYESRSGSVTFTQDGDGGRFRNISITQEAFDPTSNFTLINNTEDSGVKVHSFSRQQVGPDGDKIRTNYATNTLDKDTNTLWAGEDDEDGDKIADGDGEFIIFDLNGTYDLDLIQLSTNDKSDAYGIQLWTSESGTDIEDFTQVIPENGGIELTPTNFTDFNKYLVNSIDVRYVKLMGFGRFNSSGVNNSVWTNITEIEFFGEGEAILSIEEDLLKEVLVYPIPAKGTLYLKNLKTDISKLEIINLEGKTILSKDVSNSSGTLSVDTSSLGNGLYVLRISNVNDYSVSKKIVIQQ